MSELSVDERRRLLRSIYLTIFLTSTAYGTITFLLPVYAEGLGATYIELGLLGSVGSVVYTAMTLLTGLMLDRFERIKFYLVFTAFGAVVPVLFSLTSQVPQLFALRGLLGVVSAAFWVTASTLTADISPPEELTKSVVRYNVSWISGFVAGPILGGIVSDRYGFPTLFILDAILIIPSVILIATKLSGRLTLRAVTGGIWKGLTSLRPITLAYITLIPYAIVLGIYMAILPGHMGVLGISASAIGLLLTMTNAVRGLGFLSGERWVSWGTRRSLWVSSILMSGALFMVSTSNSTAEFALPLALYGFGGGIITPVLLDYIAHRSPNEALGAAMGLHEFVYGVGMSLGPIVGGAIAEAYNPSTLYLLLAALVLFIIPFSMAFRSNKPKAES
jgi:DHA1 family multidrug resistance protein-like MFS transporter